MIKKTLITLGLIALLVGTLVAQPMMNGRNRNMADNCDNNGKQFRMEQGRMGHHQAKGDHRQHHRKGDGLHVGMMIIHNAEELELKDSQIEDIKDIASTFHKLANVTKAELENLRIDKREAMMNKNYSEAKKVTKAIFSKKEELELKEIDAKKDIMDVLTETQQEKFETLCKKGPRK